MARNYAQIKVTIWQDDDFRALPVPAQHLYFLLLTSPTLNLAGVTDWRPNRLATLSAGWTPKAVRAASTALVEAGYVLIDDDTEEALVRTLIRHDGILRNPKTTSGMVSAWTGTYSLRIRRCIAEEVAKLANEGVRDVIRSGIAVVLDYLSDTQSDTQSDQAPDRASDQVPVPQTTNNQQPATINQEREGASAPRAHRLPADFEPSDQSRLTVMSEYPQVDIHREHAKFLDYWAAQPGQRGVKLDWDATWRNWMRRAGDESGRRPKSRQQETDDLFARNAARMGINPDQLALEGRPA